MKYVITLLATVLISLSVSAQFNNLKGVTFHANAVKYESDERDDENSFYFFSFTNKILMHQVLTENNKYSDGQFYKLTNITKNYHKADEKSVYTFDALSGISGKTYKYTITIYDDGTGNVVCNDGKFFGTFYEIKTYAQ